MKKSVFLVFIIVLANVFFMTCTAFATVFPRASNQPSSTIYYINAEGYSFSDIFMMTSLQGNINRAQSQIVHDGSNRKWAPHYTI